MARGVNKVILIGNIGKNPEVKYMPNGNAVATITLATTESWKDKNSGEQVDKVEWHRVVFFKRLAEVVGEYLKKGSKIYIEGKLQTRKWQDKNGKDCWTTEIVANEMQMLDNKGGEYAGNNASSNAHQSRPESDNSPAANNEFDDKIPF